MNEKNNFVWKEHKVSIVVPVYNAGKVLCRCIESILKQSFSDFSLVLVNDGSTDNSGDICDRYAKKDSRIHVIHKNNGGSVEARKTGVLSRVAQNAEYIAICDADDILATDALKKLYEVAKNHNADLVCAKVGKLWKIFKLHCKNQSPCFKSSKVEYNHDDIIDKLYISCFGISDFPVTLCAKLYKKELISKAVDNPAVVHFMGDDLSVTLNVLQNAERLIIIPDTVYFYRVGGNTSKFMPYMIEDFLNLYIYKKAYAEKYPMPQDWQYLMDVELMNILNSWLVSFRREGKHTKSELIEEVKHCCGQREIENAAKKLYNRKYEIGKQVHPMAGAVVNKDYNSIVNKVLEGIKKDKCKYVIKKMLMYIQ